MLRLLICAIFFAIGSAAMAGPRALEWNTLKSEFIELRPVELPKKQPFLQWLIFDREFLKYDVGLASTGNIPADCRWRSFRAANLTVRDEKLAYAYLEKCEQSLQNGPVDTPQNLYRSLMISLPIDQHPYMRRVILSLPNGFKLPGLLAMKDTTARRPLIIFRSGIFGNSLDVLGERSLLIQAFEQTGFNVLMLDSMMSPETIEMNERYSVGGLDEGLQNYQVGRRLLDKKEPFSKLISEVHFMALSMGGHGMWLTMLLNQINPKVFSTAVGICPLVEFERTFAKHQRSPMTFWQMNVWAFMRISIFRERVQGMTMRRFLLDAFDWVEKNFKGPLTDDGTVKFPVELRGESGKVTEFRKGNDLAPLIGQIKTPVSVFSTLKDDVVPYELNGQKLVDLMVAQAGTGFVRILPMREGVHCSFPGAYDWDEFSDLLVDQFGVGTKPPPGSEPVAGRLKSDHEILGLPAPRPVKGIPPPPPPPPPPGAPGSEAANVAGGHLMKNDSNAHASNLVSLEPKVPAKTRVEKVETGFPAGVALLGFEAPIGSRSLVAEIQSGTEKRRIEIPLVKLDWAVVGQVQNKTESNALVRWARHNISVDRAKGGDSVLRWVVYE